MDTFYCRDCGVGFWAKDAQDAASQHGDSEHPFRAQARIDETVTDPMGRTCQVTAIVEDGELALVRYADGSEDEFDAWELEVR